MFNKSAYKKIYGNSHIHRDIDAEICETESLEETEKSKNPYEGHLYEELMKDYRMKKGLKACINCGICTAVCPAAEFYNYNPKNIVNIVQRKNEKEIEMLLKSNTIWYCGECMSCVTRCPRDNAPGLVVMALRRLSMKTGYYMESEKGRQQYVVIKDFCSNILKYGYCVYPRNFSYDTHKEFGLVGKWINEHLDDVHKRMGSNLDGDGPGGLRKVPKESLNQLKNIFDVTGATDVMNKVLNDAHNQAVKENISDEEYFTEVYTVNHSEKHLNKYK